MSAIGNPEPWAKKCDFCSDAGSVCTKDDQWEPCPRCQATAKLVRDEPARLGIKKILDGLVKERDSVKRRLEARLSNLNNRIGELQEVLSHYEVPA